MTETDDFDGLVGQNVRNLRVARGMNQEQLAAEVAERGLQFRQQTIAKIESGQRPLRLQEAIELVSALNADVDVLLNGPKVTGEIRRQQELAVLEAQAQDVAQRVTDLTMRLDDEQSRLDAIRRRIARIAATKVTSDGMVVVQPRDYLVEDEDGDLKVKPEFLAMYNAAFAGESPLIVTVTSLEAAEAEQARLEAEYSGPFEIRVVTEEEAEAARAKRVDDLKHSPSWVAGMARESLAEERAES